MVIRAQREVTAKDIRKRAFKFPELGKKTKPQKKAS